MSHDKGKDTASNEIDIEKSFNEYDSEVDVDGSFNKSIDSHDNNSKNLNNNQTFAVDKSSDDDTYVTKNSTENKTATDSFNDTDVENKVEESYNTKTENKTEDSFNTKNESEVEDSNNTTNTNTNLNLAVDNAFNTHKVIDSNNTKVEDSHNTKNETDIDDSFNTKTTELNTSIQDAFNYFNDESTAYGNIDVDFDNMFNGAFGGDGSDAGFAVSQIANILDADYLHDVDYNGQGSFSLKGGSGDVEYAGEDSWDCVDDPFGGNTSADTSFAQSGSAFNFEVVLGANLQQNAIDSVVVGGSQDNDTTTTSGDSF